MMRPGFAVSIARKGRIRFWMLEAAWMITLFLGQGAGAEPLPVVIVSQPQSRSVEIGTTTTFSVVVSRGDAALPDVTSGQLQLWLKADSGVVTDNAGHVSAWKDQSGNDHNALQENRSQQPLLAPSVSAIGGRPALRFNGDQDNIHGSYLRGEGYIGIPNALTTFVVYNAFVATNKENLLWLIGQPGLVYGASRCDDVFDGNLHFSTWAHYYQTDFKIPTNTYRLWMDWTDRSVRMVHICDVTADKTTTITKSISNPARPDAGYFIGGLNPELPFVESSRCFNGDIAEFLCYRGSLSEADRQAVINYLQQKYLLTSGEDSLHYQWQKGDRQISDATNATLTLTNIDANDAGMYSVTIKNAGGAAKSVSAALTVFRNGHPVRPVGE